MGKLKVNFKFATGFVVSAVLLTLIQVPWGIGWLAWVALVPFILSCKVETKTWRLVWVSYVVSAVYWLGNLYWIGYVTVPGYVLFCLYLGLYWPILAILLRYFRRKWPRLPLCVVIPFLFLGAESWQGILITGFSWRLLAHSQYDNLRLIQIADIFGAAGISLIVAMVNGFVAEAIIAYRGGKLKTISNLAKGVAVAGILAGVVMYGDWRLGQSDEFISDGPLIGSIQPNIPSNIKELADAGRPILDGLLPLSKGCFDAGAKLVGWPETIVLTTLNSNFVELCDEDSEPQVFNRIVSEHCKDNGYVLLGAHRTELEERDDEYEITDRYNSAFLYRPDGEQDEKVYNKMHLVPFGEFIPGTNNPLIYKLLLLLSPYDYLYNLTKGTEYTSFEVKADGKKYNFGVLICYEDTDAEVARKMTVDENGNKKADWLVNISNDGWYVGYKNGKVITSGELGQRTVITIFRAVESRVSIIRSVNTGVSCLIDSTGRLRDGFINGTLPEKALDREGVEGWFVDRVGIDSRVSFFSTHGKLLDLCGAIGFCLAIIAVLADKFIGFECGGKTMVVRIKTFSIVGVLCLLALSVGCLEQGQTASNSGYIVQPERSNVAKLRSKAIGIVKDGLGDDDNLLRTQAIEIVSTTQQTELMPYVIGLLRSNSVPVRFSAAIAIGETRYSKGEFAVKRLLKDPDENVRIASAYALTKLGRGGLSDNIRNALKSSNQTVRANAALLIGKLGDKNDVDLLYSLIKSGNSANNVKLQAVESIAMLGDKNIYRSKLWPLLISKYADDRILGIKSMGHLRSRRAKDAISTMLQDDVPEVRLAAAGELGTFGDKSGAYEVNMYLKKNTSATTDQGKIFAAMAIGQIKDATLSRFLPGLIKDKSKNIRLTAAMSVLLIAK